MDHSGCATVSSVRSPRRASHENEIENCLCVCVRLEDTQVVGMELRRTFRMEKGLVLVVQSNLVVEAVSSLEVV